MQGRAFLAVAYHLHPMTDEAFFRTRIGRAYYAAYLESRTFCEQHLGFTRTMTSREHQEIARLLRQVDREIANMLKFMRGFRNAADYDLHISGSTISQDAAVCEAYAKRIIARLDELAATRNSSSEPPSSIDAHNPSSPE